MEVVTPPMFQFYQSLAATPLAKLTAALVRTLERAGGEMGVGELSRAVRLGAGVGGKLFLEAMQHALDNGVVVRTEAGRLALPAAARKGV
jgi:hypothetical protein